MRHASSAFPLGDVPVDCRRDGASAGLGAAKVSTLDHLGFDGLGPALRLTACWKARRAGRKSAHADLDMEDARAITRGTLANCWHDVSLHHCARIHALRRDDAPTSRGTVPAVCQGYPATLNAVTEALDS